MLPQEKTRITTIKIQQETKARIEKFRSYKRESYDEIMQRILEILNLSRVSPERARSRLIALERNKRRTKSKITHSLQDLRPQIKITKLN